MTNLALDEALVTNIQVLYLTEVPDGLKLNIGGLYSFVLQPTKIKFQTNALINECKQTKLSLSTERFQKGFNNVSL